MKEIVRINHLGLRVRDLDTARGFYEKLGFEFLAGPLGPEPVAVMEHPSGININFILNASPDASPVNLLMDVAAKHTGYTHVALEVSDRLGWVLGVDDEEENVLVDEVVVRPIRSESLT